jgi:hypothetical protein
MRGDLIAAPTEITTPIPIQHGISDEPGWCGWCSAWSQHWGVRPGTGGSLAIRLSNQPLSQPAR